MVKNNSIRKRGKADYIYENLHLTALDDGTFKIIGVTDKTIAEIEIPDCVSTIGDKAFYDCWNLIKVTIPDSVKYIGKSAFEGCEKLVSISIPTSVTDIAEATFRACRSLTMVEIPSGVTDIGEYAFCACRSLANITIPDGVKSIESNTFTSCESLANVNIPNSVTNIGSCAFEYCSNLTSIKLPRMISSIGNDAFACCFALVEVYNLSNLDITKGSSDNGGVAYYARDVYTSISEPSKLSNLDGMILHTDSNNITLVEYNGDATCVTIPNNVTSIGNDAFHNCRNLTSVTIPNSVTSIEEYAFCDCRSLTSITVPNSVTNIGNSAFAKCISLTEVYNLSKLNITKGSLDNGSIAYYARDIYTSLSEPSKLSNLDGMIFHADSDNVTLVKYNGDATSVVIPDGVTIIGEGAFFGNVNLTTVSIPNSVTIICASAFRCCNALTQITLPASVTHIGNHAFLACSSLTNLTIPYNVKFIDTFAFESCDNLISVIFENKSDWFLSENKSETNGDSITVTDPSQNATNLREFYFKYCWKRV